MRIPGRRRNPYRAEGVLANATLPLEAAKRPIPTKHADQVDSGQPEHPAGDHKGRKHSKAANVLVRSLPVALTLAFATLLASADGGTAPQVHADWETLVATEAGETRFRAMTGLQTASTAFLLISDRTPEDCRAEYLSINFTGPNGFDRDLLSEPMPGEMRVDDFPLRHLAFSVSFQMGDETGIVTILGWDRQEGLHRELHEGDAVRFKLKFDRDEVYLKFSLRGFGAATDRTWALCEAHAEAFGRDSAPAYRSPWMPLSTGR